MDCNNEIVIFCYLFVKKEMSDIRLSDRLTKLDFTESNINVNTLQVFVLLKLSMRL